jgi:putative two-component system response regulator
MKESDEDEGLEAIEELEAVEELEEFVEEETPIDSLLLNSTFLRDLARSYEKNPAPLAIIDATLSFVYQNPTFRLLARDYRYPSSSQFPGLFARSLDAAALRGIKDALRDAARAFTWKGLVSHRIKDAAARITKVVVQPLWPFEAASPTPSAYAVWLDDVTEENRKTLRGMFSSLLEASKMKDNDTGSHIQRVNLYSALLTQKLYRDPRWPEVDIDFIEDIGFLAAMHDVGKIGTPDDILNKAGPLNEFEWSIMKEHTINGAFILSSYPTPMAKQIALSHHEWWNGAGYPYKLVGGMIPLSARIVTIADVYDALRMKRSYKPPFPHETAVAKIVEDRGLHFDPDLVDVFMGMEGGFEEIYGANAD